MLPKLALGNVKKSIRDYTIYFLTIAFGVCIFYLFNSVESQQAMMQTSEGQRLALNLLSKFMDIFSVFISAALCFLIIYANGFLVKRRKKEFGVYLILGMERGAISWILVMETVLVGLAGLVAGLLIGVLISQGMTLVTARLLNSTISTYHFVFSLVAVGKTALYFGLTFLLTLIFNVVTIGRQRLIDLLNSARKNESLKLPHFTRSVILFAVAVVCLGFAYYFMSLDSFLTDMRVFASAVILAIAGTFLFFFSLSGFFLKLIQQRKNLYFRNLNMFVLRQINSKIHTNYVSMTFVCLMLSFGICALSSGIGVANSITAMQSLNAPFDATVEIRRVANEETGDLTPYARLNVVEALREQGMDIESFATSWTTIAEYESPVSLNMQSAEGEAVSLQPKIISLSDYNATLAMRGDQPITLEKGTFALHANEPSDKAKEVFDAYLKTSPTLDINGAVLSSASSLYTTMMQTTQTRVENVQVIVPDEYVEASEGHPALPVLRTLLNIDYKKDAGNASAIDGSLVEFFDDRGIRTSDNVVVGGWVEARTNVLQVGSSATTITAYIALYIGMVFLIASAALLAIAQLSEASDNVSRYRLLGKIGTEDKMLRGALFSQIAIYFGAPLALALLHSVVGITVLCTVFATLKDTYILQGSLIAFLVIVAVYGGYFMATYLGGRSILNREVINHLAQR
jgi:putative ABC transport system permease protein